MRHLILLLFFTQFSFGQVEWCPPTLTVSGTNYTALESYVGYVEGRSSTLDLECNIPITITHSIEVNEYGSIVNVYNWSVGSLYEGYLTNLGRYYVPSVDVYGYRFRNERQRKEYARVRINKVQAFPYSSCFNRIIGEVWSPYRGDYIETTSDTSGVIRFLSGCGSDDYWIDISTFTERKTAIGPYGDILRIREREVRSRSIRLRLN